MVRTISEMTPRLTLNLGLRWEQYNNTFDSPSDRARESHLSDTSGHRQPLRHTARNFPIIRISNRAQGLARDVRGNGKDVVRLSFGLFYVQQVQHATFQQDVAQKPAQSSPEIISDTAIGVGPLASFVYGVTPLSPRIRKPSTILFPAGGNTAGYWWNPNNLPDARTQQWHAGWSHVFADAKDVFSVDFTYMILHHGWRSLDINPLINGVRPLSALTQKVYGDPNLLGPVDIVTAVGEATYNETAVHFEHRFSAKTSFQVNYILAWSYGQGGNSDGATTLGGYASGAPAHSNRFGDGVVFTTHRGNRGPTAAVDERHRITATGLFNLPFKIDLTPSLTLGDCEALHDIQRIRAVRRLVCGAPERCLNNPIGVGVRKTRRLLFSC